MSSVKTSFLSPATPNELQCVAAVKQQLGITEANNNCGPGRKSPYLDPTDTSFFLDDITLFRFARSAGASPAQTVEKLNANFTWRKQYRPFATKYEEVKPFFDLGVCFCRGFSAAQNVPVIYVTPMENNPIPAEGRVRAILWLYEELQRRGYREFVFVINLSWLQNPNAEDDKHRDLATKVDDMYYPIIESRAMVVGGVSFAMKMIIKLVMAFLAGWKTDTIYIMPDESEVAAVIPPQARYNGMPGGLMSIAPYKPSDVLVMLPPPLPGSPAATGGY